MWWQTRPRDGQAPGPQVHDYRTIPSGVVPAHLQQWVTLAVVLGMVAILSVAGAPTSKSRSGSAPNSAAAVVDVNQQRVEDYQRRVQEQAQRLAAEQAALQRAKQALTGPATPASPATPTSPSAVSRGDGASRATARGALDARAARGPLVDNVAFTKTVNDPPGNPAAIAPTPAPPAPPATVRSASGSEIPPHAGSRTYRVGEGTVLETVLTNRLDGTFAAPVNCLVTTPVYDADVQRVLIPAGARVLGEARPVNVFGQSRLAVSFHRLVLPNRRRIDLNGFHGLNQIGDEGLQDQVNRHYAQIFGASLAVGAIAGLAEAQAGVGLDAGSADLYRQSAAANLAQSSARILDRFLNLLPTVTIREGHRVKVYLANDLELPPYEETTEPPAVRR